VIIYFSVAWKLLAFKVVKMGKKHLPPHTFFSWWPTGI